MADAELETVARKPEETDVAQAAGGDARAFERLYRAHVAHVHGLARRMAGDDLADELTQEAFVRAWQKLWSFRGESAFATWLHRVAVNVILARRAAVAGERSRRVDGMEILERTAARPAAPDLAMDFETAIRGLPDGARQIFVLHDVEGYRHEEIATLLGVTSGTSKAQLHRARMLLRGRLER
jgi:RNA polymerase sigma-70 factor (ECF subfamily)